MLARLTTRVIPLLFMAALVVTVPASLRAQSITFTFAGAGGSGTLDGVAFSNKAVTLSGVGSVFDRQSMSNGFFVEHTTATVNIEDVGSFTFLTATRTFIASLSGIVGFSRESGADLFNGLLDPTGTPWDMTTSLGPVAYTGNFLQWGLSDVVTTGGVLFLQSAPTAATFEAVVQPVPEPPFMLLLFAGVGGVLLAVRRRRSQRD